MNLNTPALADAASGCVDSPAVWQVWRESCKHIGMLSARTGEKCLGNRGRELTASARVHPDPSCFSLLFLHCFLQMVTDHSFLEGWGRKTIRRLVRQTKVFAAVVGMEAVSFSSYCPSTTSSYFACSASVSALLACLLGMNPFKPDKKESVL